MPFNAKKYQRGLKKAGHAITSYAPKRRAEVIADGVVKKKMKLSEKTAEPMVAVRSVPIPVDVNKGVDEGAATIKELLAGMNDDVDDITLTEMLAGEDSLDTVISGSDVDNFFDSTEDTPASDDANHVEIDVTEISIKEEVDDDLQFVKYLSKSERETEERLVFSEAMVGSLEDEVSRGRENLDALKAEREVYISSLTAKCEGLKKEHEELKKLALGCETRLEDSDQRY